MNIDGTNTLACTHDMKDFRARADLSAAAPHVKDLSLISPISRPAGVDPAVAADRLGHAAEGVEAEPRRAGKARRAVRVHPVRVLLDLVPELLVEQRALSRPGGAAAGLSLDQRQPR
jgi:hypothetical protein